VNDEDESPVVLRGPPRLLSRWEFHSVTYVLVTVSADDDGCHNMKWMPEEAYRNWTARRPRTVNRD
jgi:hypothetical protein